MFPKSLASHRTMQHAICINSVTRCRRWNTPTDAWYAERLAILEDRVRARLRELSSRLGRADWLDGEFSAGDLLMVSVLLRAKGSGILDEYPNLSAYLARGEARPAYQRAFAAQLAVFTAASTN